MGDDKRKAGEGIDMCVTVYFAAIAYCLSDDVRGMM